jgi:hypothetical protein
LFHNESLQILDVVAAAVVEEPPRNDPPATASAGSCYIVGGQPTGEWAGKQNALVAFTAAGWRFVTPTDGFGVFIRSNGTTALHRNGGWQVAQAIAAPAGGAQVDAEARVAISAILTVLRDRGLIS